MSENITIPEAIKLGVKAHRSGDLINADRFYTAILDVQPNHPDANHNMGILAWGMDKKEEALSYFRKAVNSNLEFEEYWLSLANATLEIKGIEAARSILGEAQTHGISGKKFHALEQKLLDITSDIPREDELSSLIELYSSGDFKEAKKQAEQKLKKYPGSATVYNILGAINAATKCYDAAIENYETAIKLSPNLPDSYYNLGNAYRNCGDTDASLRAYKKALEINPEYFEAYFNMGNVLMNAGREVAALEIYNKALQINPTHAGIYNNIGNILKNENKLSEAIQVYKKALELDPQNISIYINMGLTLKAKGHLNEAVNTFTKAIEINKDSADAHFSLANTLSKKGELKSAVKSYLNTIKIRKDYPDVHNNLGNCYADLGEIGLAISCYKVALKYNPRDAKASTNFGIVFSKQGYVSKAISRYKTALAIEPTYCDAHLYLSKLTNYDRDDSHLWQMYELQKNANLDSQQSCKLSFAIAKAHEDKGEYEQAFVYYLKANAMRKSVLEYDVKKEAELFDLAQRKYNLINDLPDMPFNNQNSPTPIFIVGMPRSGTTLVEQIITSHSEVSAGGELNFVDKFGSEILLGKKDVNRENLQFFQKSYLEKITKLANNRKYVTDKMPQNFYFISLIRKTLPTAKIIHVKRNPQATCWSNFKQYFVGDGLGFSYDLEDLTAYYNNYKKLMEFWNNCYSKFIFDIDYELLTQEQKLITQKLIAHIGLEWEDKCLSPHLNKRIVNTASYVQINKKMYTGSSDRWQRYKSFLNGAFDTLIN